MMPRYVTAMPNLQAASPAVETAHLVSLLGSGAEVLRSFGVGLLALSALGFFTALFSAVSERRRELALLRALGAPPRLLFGLVTLEGLLLGLAGGVAAHPLDGWRPPLPRTPRRRAAGRACPCRRWARRSCWCCSARPC